MERAEQYKGNKVTFRVVLASVIASLGGFIFGYLGVFGLLAVEDIFYDVFVTDSYEKNPRDYDYCKYSNRFDFPAYSGPIYLGGSLAAILAYPFITKYGRRKIVLFSGIVLLIGTVLNAIPFYVNYVGMVVLGAGIGFGSQAILLYLSEIAPPRFRGSFITLFPLMIALGILAGNMIEKDHGRYGLRALIVGWGFPVIPALFLIFGAKYYLPETPTSLADRGMAEEARQVLTKIRGTDDVDAEFRDILAASEFAKETRNVGFGAAKNILYRRNKPQLVMAVLIPVFQNLTGVLFVVIYARLMFGSLGYRSRSGFYSLAINGTVLVVSALMCSATVDKFGRKALLIGGGVLMIICQVMIGVILGSNLFNDQLTTNKLSIVLTVLMGIFVLAYGWSWGPLGWTIPSEIFTLETRSVGLSISVSLNLLFTYLVLQFFIPLLCAFNYGLFLFFGVWTVVMTVFVCLLLPETKGVPIEEVGLLWSNHWFWRRFVAQDSQVPYLTQASRGLVLKA